MKNKKSKLLIIGVLVVIIAVLAGVFVMKSPRQEKDYIVVTDSEKIELIDLASENKDSIVIDEITGEEYFGVYHLSPDKDKVVYANNVRALDFDRVEYDVMFYDIKTQNKKLFKENVVSFSLSKDFNTLVYQVKDNSNLYKKNLVTGDEEVLFKNCNYYYSSEDANTFLCFDKYDRCYMLKQGEEPCRIGEEYIEIYQRNSDFSEFLYREADDLVRYKDGEIEELMDNFIPEYGEYVAENELVYSMAESAKINDLIIDDMAQEDENAEIVEGTRAFIREEIRRYKDIANLTIEFSQVHFYKDNKMNLVSDAVLDVLFNYINPETGENIVIAKVLDRNNLPEIKISELDDDGLINAIELVEIYTRIVKEQTNYSVFKNGEFVGTVDDLTLDADMDYATYVEDESTIYFRSVDSVNYLKNYNRSTIYSVKIEDGKLGELQKYTGKIKSSNEIFEEFEGKLVYSAENEDGKETLYWGDEPVATGFIDLSIYESMIITMGKKKPTIIVKDGEVKTYDDLKGYYGEVYVADSGEIVCYGEKDELAIIEKDRVTILPEKYFQNWVDLEYLY